MATDPLRDKLDEAADRADNASKAFYNVLTFDKDTPVPVEGGTVESMSKRIYDQVGASIDTIEEKANQAIQAAQDAEDAKNSAQADAAAAGEAKDGAEAAQSAAATSATQAQDSATAASGSASAAQTSANNAADSANAASASASDVVAAKDAAVAAKDQAQASSSAAGTYASNAVNSATDASNAASSAATSETNAKGYSDSAMAYRDEAEEHATASESSATAASGSASAASASANAAQTSANSAQSYATTASTAASDATAAKNEAVDAKNQAQAASSSAQSYAASAVNSATDALASENAAASSETNALAYANQAKEDAESSDVNAQAAQASANNASTSEANAKTSEINASNSASAADVSASAAQAAAVEAGQSKVDAAGYAYAAKSSEINAKNSESNAEDYAESALNSAQDAQAIKDSFTEFDGDIQPDASWVAVPAHKDDALDAQAQALANRDVVLRHAAPATTPYEHGAVTDGVTSDAEAAYLAQAEAAEKNSAVLYPSADWTGLPPARNIYGAGYVNALYGRLQAGTEADPLATPDPILWLTKFTEANRSTNPSEWDSGAGYFALIKQVGDAYGAAVTGAVRHNGGAGHMIGGHFRGEARHENAEAWGGWSYGAITGPAAATGAKSAIAHEFNVNNQGPDVGWNAGAIVGSARGLVVTIVDGGGNAQVGMTLGSGTGESGKWWTGIHLRGNSFGVATEALDQVGNGEAFRIDGSILSNATGAIRFYGGNFRYGISFAESSFSNNCAILLADNQRISVGSGPNSSRYLGFNRTDGWANFNNLLIRINGVQVVGAQKPAIANVSATTVEACVATINTMLNTMRSHGLIASA